MYTYICIHIYGDKSVYVCPVLLLRVFKFLQTRRTNFNIPTLDHIHAQSRYCKPVKASCIDLHFAT